MKEIFEKWWNRGTRYFGIINYKKAWKKNGLKPQFCIHENGGRRKNGDSCFDVTMIIGYTVFNYTNFCLQGLKR